MAKYKRGDVIIDTTLDRNTRVILNVIGHYYDYVIINKYSNHMERRYNRSIRRIDHWPCIKLPSLKGALLYGDILEKYKE
jgi:hypothetical protein